MRTRSPSLSKVIYLFSHNINIQCKNIINIVYKIHAYVPSRWYRPNKLALIFFGNKFLRHICGFTIFEDMFDCLNIDTGVRRAGVNMNNMKIDFGGDSFKNLLENVLKYEKIFLLTWNIGGTEENQTNRPSKKFYFFLFQEKCEK